jgi:MFS family permease
LIPYRNFTALLARSTGITLIANLPYSLTGAMSVQIGREFDLEAAGVASVVGVFFAAACVSSITLGRVVEHVGPRTGMQAVAGLSAASLVVGGFANSLVVLGLSLAIGGIATAIVTPAVHMVVSAEIPSQNHGLAFGFLRAAQPAAILVSGLAVALAVGWHAAFFIAAAIAVATGAAIRRWQRALVRDGAAAVASADGRRKVELGDKRNLLMLAGAMALASGVVNVVGPFFVASAVDGGRSEAFAGVLLAIGSTLGMLGRLVVGWFADRGQWDALKGVAALLAGGSVGCLLLAAHGSLALSLGALLAFGLGASWPGLFQSAVVRRYRQAPAVATGYTQTGAFFGSIVAPLGFGFAATTASFEVAWLVTAGIAVVAATLMLSANARVAPVPDVSIAPIPVHEREGNR